MLGVHAAMPHTEREEFAKWEKENVPPLGSSDWPGWEKYIGKAPEGKVIVAPTKKTGFIYVLKSSSGLYKIGRATNLEARFAAYRTHSPEHLQVSLVIKVSDVVNCEAELHKLFNHCREHGEWFRLSDADFTTLEEILALETKSDVDNHL